MNKSKMLLIVLIFGILCLVYYCLFPKYSFHIHEIAIFRCNRITGKVQWRLAAGEFPWITLKEKEGEDAK